MIFSAKALSRVKIFERFVETERLKSNISLWLISSEELTEEELTEKVLVEDVLTEDVLTEDVLTEDVLTEDVLTAEVPAWEVMLLLRSLRRLSASAYQIVCRNPTEGSIKKVSI